jgi:ribonuclease R
MGARAASPDGFVGLLAKRGRFRVAVPLFEPLRAVTVDVRRRADVSLGEMVFVKGGRRGHGRPEVVRSLGRPDVARDVVEALLVERGHGRQFARRVEEDARAAVNDGPGFEPRRDLTAMATFTIDPAEARDFDDAISLEEDGDSLKLYVHIADVAHHVAPGSPTDAEAHRRGNSVYVPGAVEPMLPEVLSSDACSLVPGMPRKVVTVEMRMGAGAVPASVAFYRSLIRSDARLTYEEVERVFKGQERAPERVAVELARARELARRLRANRLSRGALGLETSEPEFEFDAEGHVVRAIDDVQTESHELIEELMILANETVASELERRSRGTLYRVHEQPEPAAVKFLAEQLESLDVPTPPIPEHLTPRTAGEVVGAVGAAVMKHVERTGRGRSALTSLVLRSLKAAYYAPDNVGHAGLASSAYCHFTSPIRRYPDLVVHRALLAAVGADSEPPPTQELGETGSHCSITEREATKVEREADDICLTFLAEHHLAREGRESEFEGEVSGVISAGAFVSFKLEEGAADCEGFLPARKLRGDFFELNDLGTALVGRRTGKTVKLTDPVTVAVDGLEPPRGRIDLVPRS